MVTDKVLIKKCKEGDQQAIEKVLSEKKTLVNQVVRKFFLIGAQTEDLIQEGMIGLYKAILTYDDLKNDNFELYAKLCIQSQVLNAIKSANKKSNFALNSSLSLNKQGAISCENDIEDDDFGIEIASFNSDPLTGMISKENIQKINKEIDENLSVFEKNVLQLYLNGLSIGEIAESINKPYKSIDNSLTRLKSKIKKII